MFVRFRGNIHVQCLQPVAGPAGDYKVNAAQERGRYDHYNEYLDKLQIDRDVRRRQEGVPAKGMHIIVIHQSGWSPKDGPHCSSYTHEHRFNP